MTEPAPPATPSMSVAWLRQVSPYFRQHRGKTFVVYLDGDTPDDDALDIVVRDLLLLANVGVRLVVVFGARAKIEARLNERGIAPAVVGELRATDAATVREVRDVVGSLRLHLEAAFSYGARGGPDHAHSHRVTSGNFVLARPAGVVDGVDLGFTGLVRDVDQQAIEDCLDRGEIVLIPPLGYSPTGELFNLRAQDLAASVASELRAAKLVFLLDREGLRDVDGEFVRQLTVVEAGAMRDGLAAGDPQHEVLDTAIRACRLGVERVHVVSQHEDGALLAELFTRDGAGTMISSAPFDQLRAARADDVGGILDLIKPLEDEGLLVKRSREKLENEIEHFVVMVREHTVVACAALYPWPEQGMAELACVAVHPEYRGSAFGEMLLDELERRARAARLERVFVLTTQASQWFAERGFENGSPDLLPVPRQEMYNYQRNSTVMVKSLG